MKHVFWLTLALWIGIFSLLSAQPAVFQGSVYDRASREPLSEVVVTVEGTTLASLTNRQGLFVIQALPFGIYKARFERPGYETLWREIVVEQARVSIGLAMDRTAIDQASRRAVSPQRFARDPFLSPGAVGEVSQLEVARRAPADAGQALAGQAGLWTYQQGLGQAALSLRGLSGQRVLMTLDGIRLSPLLWGDGPDSYLGLLDVQAWDRVEVLPGGGGLVPYGSDAIGGLVQVFSRTLPYADEGWQVHGDASTVWRQAGQQLGGRGRLSLHQRRVAAEVQGGRWQMGDRLAAGGVILPGTGYEAESAQGRMRVKLSARHDLSLGYQTFRQTGLSRHGSLAGDSLAGWPARDRQLAYLRWHAFSDNPWWHEVEVTASWQQLDLTQTGTRLGGALEQTGTTTLASRGLTLVAHSEPNPYWHAVSGLEYYGDQVRHLSTRQPLPSGNPERVRGWLPGTANSTHLAAFTFHTLDILKLRIHLGGRAQGQRLDVPAEGTFAPVSLQDLGFSGNLGALYPLHPNWHLVTAFQTGFRPPNLHDLSAFTPFELGMAVPTDSLGPERSLNSEIGLKAQTPHFSGTLMLYRTRLSDMIDWVEGTYQGQATFEGLPVFQRENIGEAFVQGVEASVEVPVLPALAFYGTFTYTRGRYLGRDEAMRRIPPLQGRLGLRFESPQGLWSRVEWQHAARQDFLSVADRIDPAISPLGTPGWHVVHLHVGYDFGWGYLTLGVQNLLDEAYVHHGSRLPEPGRTFLLSAQIGF